jgi:hypothetical protein
MAAVTVLNGELIAVAQTAGRRLRSPTAHQEPKRDGQLAGWPPAALDGPPPSTARLLELP